MLKVNEKKRELYIYEAIGPSWAGMVSAEDMVDALEQLGPGDLTVALNTPGGVADDAFAMVELLKRHEGSVSVRVDSLAASAGTFFLQKPFAVTAAKTARIMIHNPIALTYGNVKDHEKTIDILSKYGESIKHVYSRMNLPDEELSALLDSESWYTAKEALAANLIDFIDEDAPVVESAKIRNGLYKKTPDDLLIKPVKVETPNRTAASLRIRQIAAKLRTNHG